MSCEKCGKENHTTANCMNGSKDLFKNELRHQEEIGKLEHTNFAHRVDTIENSHLASVKSRDEQIKTLTKSIDDKTNHVSKKIDDKFKFSLILASVVLASMGTYIINGDMQLKDALHTEFNIRTDALEKEIDILRFDLAELENDNSELETKIAIIEGIHKGHD